MTSQLAPARILIVDDHPIVRAGLALRLSMHRNWEVCGEAGTQDEALALVDETNPDLVLVDISLKSGNGIDLIKQVNSRYPAVKMLVVSGFQESLYAERALRAGALGYLNKQESNDKLVEAISTVLRGERFLSPAMTQRLVARAVSGCKTTKDPVEYLSDREIEIFRLIGEGLTSGAIADKLFISTHTLDTHRENLKRKLGAANAAALNRRAVQWLLENG